MYETLLAGQVAGIMMNSIDYHNTTSSMNESNKSHSTRSICNTFRTAITRDINKLSIFGERVQSGFNYEVSLVDLMNEYKNVVS